MGGSALPNYSCVFDYGASPFSYTPRVGFPVVEHHQPAHALPRDTIPERSLSLSPLPFLLAYSERYFFLPSFLLPLGSSRAVEWVGTKVGGGRKKKLFAFFWPSLFFPSPSHSFCSSPSPPHSENIHYPSLCAYNAEFLGCQKSLLSLSTRGGVSSIQECGKTAKREKLFPAVLIKHTSKKKNLWNVEICMLCFSTTIFFFSFSRNHPPLFPFSLLHIRT